MKIPKKLKSQINLREVLPLEVINQLSNKLFPKQLDAHLDTSQFQVICCSRRAGKTTKSVIEIAQEALRATQAGAFGFFGLENASVRSNAWEPFVALLEELNITNLFKLNASEMIAYVNRTNVKIIFKGADHPKVIETLRGNKYHRIYIDEAGTFRYDILKRFVEEIITPALGDLKGKLILQGTPPSLPNSYFEEAYKDKKFWSQHFWTFRDNPHNAENMNELLARIKEKHGWDDDHPVYRREYLGDFVYDTSRLMLKFDMDRNTCKTEDIPPVSRYLMGIDFGYRDSSAFVIIAECGNQAFVVDYFKQSEITPTEFAAEIKFAMKKYNISYHQTAADYGGLGRAILEDFRKHHGVNLQDADKTGKASAIEHFSDMLARGDLKVVHTLAPVTKELSELERDPKKPDQPKNGQEDHLFDATIYASKLLNTFTYKPEEVKNEVDLDFERAVARKDAMLRRQNGNDESFTASSGMDAWL